MTSTTTTAITTSWYSDQIVTHCMLHNDIPPLLVTYTMKHANPDLGKNMLLIKNLQFLPDHYETLSK